MFVLRSGVLMCAVLLVTAAIAEERPAIVPAETHAYSMSSTSGWLPFPSEHAFLAGAVKVDITPQHWPVSVNGNTSDFLATEAHDPLHVRCIVLDDGERRVALATVDSCMIYRETFDAAKAIAQRQTGIPASHMLISATHTHTAPTACGLFQSEPDERYVALLVERIAEAIVKADAQRRPAQIGWAVGQDDTQVFNRRWLLREGEIATNIFGEAIDRVRTNPGYNNPTVSEPAGPVDPRVPIIAVRCAESGRPLGLYANYALHYVGNVPALSADYFGLFCLAMAERLEAPDDFVAMLSNGASGDINNFNLFERGRDRQRGEQAKIVADSVADAAHAAYQTIAWHDHVTLAAAVESIDLAVRKPTESQVAAAHAQLAAARRDDTGQLIALADIYARETVLMAAYPEYVNVNLQAMRIGEVGIAAIPCEVFVEIGLELTDRTPLAPTFTVGLANGYFGYLPTPRHHALGGYETWRARSSYLQVEASEKIARAMLTLLEKVTE